MKGCLVSRFRSWFRHLYRRCRSALVMCCCVAIKSEESYEHQVNSPRISHSAKHTDVEFGRENVKKDEEQRTTPHNDERSKKECEDKNVVFACCDPLREKDFIYWKNSIKEVNTIKFRDVNILLGKTFRSNEVVWLFQLPLVTTGGNTISTLGNTLSSQCVLTMTTSVVRLLVCGYTHTWCYGKETFLSGSLAIELHSVL